MYRFSAFEHARFLVRSCTVSVRSGMYRFSAFMYRFSALGHVPLQCARACTVSVHSKTVCVFKEKPFRHLLMHTIRNTVGFCRLNNMKYKPRYPTALWALALWAQMVLWALALWARVAFWALTCVSTHIRSPWR